MNYFLLTLNSLIWFLVGSFSAAYVIRKNDKKDFFYSKKDFYSKSKSFEKIENIQPLKLKDSSPNSKKSFSQKQNAAWEKVNNTPAESLTTLNWKKTSKKDTSS